MPVARRAPQSTESDRLRPYTFHGVHLAISGSQAVGDCPFCGKEGKFSVEVATSKYKCWSCGGGEGGNALSFTRLVWQNAFEGRPGAGNGLFWAGVAADRRLLNPATVAAWGICPDRTGAWLVPGFSAEGRLDQVYRRVAGKLLPTPDIWPVGKVMALHMPVGDFDPARPNIVYCEGPWDGMALWEVWPRDRQTNIVAVPGCGGWRDEWTQLCRGKCVTLLYDSDHPPTLGGYKGMQRVAKRLSGVASSVRYVRWGENGYDPDRVNGWDVRDHLTNAGMMPISGRKVLLEDLMSKVVEAPREWFNPAAPIINGHAHTASVEAMACYTWATCEAAWKDAMWWRTDLSDGLAVLLAVCASTQQSGNQLCVDLVGSAGSGKTMLCEGLLVSGNCHHLEHLTGFHSGWKLEDDRTKDCSLIARINGKTLITCEFDVMRAAPRYSELMAQQRRIFDGKSGATYKNTDKDTLHVGLRTPWIRAGTHAIMDTDQSSMGDRFLRFIIADPSTEDEKRSIMRAAMRSERVAMLDRANNTAGSIVDPKTRKAHALTGGYVDWLRANVEDELAKVDVSESAEDRCLDLAELSADLRARPNEDKRKLETHETKELPTRLARQNVRLATCLAVVLNKRSVDADVLRIVRKVALDTAFGHSLNIVQWLCSRNPKNDAERMYQETGGLGGDTLAVWLGMTTERALKYMLFLRKIGVLDYKQVAQTNGLWTLTDRVFTLYLRVMGGQDGR